MPPEIAFALPTRCEQNLHKQHKIYMATSNETLADLTLTIFQELVLGLALGLPGFGLGLPGLALCLYGVMNYNYTFHVSSLLCKDMPKLSSSLYLTPLHS